MNFSLYMQIEAIPLLALALTLYLSLRELPLVQNIRRFQLLVGLTMGVLVIDGLNWHSLANPETYPIAAIWILNILYFLLTEIIAFFWFLYVYHQIHQDSLTKRQQRCVWLCIIPLLVICAVIISSPWTHSIFYIDPLDHSYHRGALHFLQAILGFGFLITASVLASIQSRKAQLPEQKKEYRFLCGIALLPLLGGLLQLLHYDLVFLWPFTAAAAVLIFIDFQTHQISTDTLTALNNRGCLERYLQKKERSHESGWYLLMIDVDRFKAINDRYGHVTGDRVLQIVSLALKNVFGPTNAFLSRFGGDEFVVIVDFPSQAQLEDTIRRVRENLQNQICENKLPFKIRLSVGYAQFESAETTPTEQMLQTADTRMYEQKRAQDEPTEKKTAGSAAD